MKKTGLHGSQKLLNTSPISCVSIFLKCWFAQRAEQEEIDLEEREGTFHDTLEASFPLMLGLSSNISIQSLNDLLTLSNITIGLYRLSHVDSAERAQRWMYKLPKLYHSQLAQEHLIINAKDTPY